MLLVETKIHVRMLSNKFSQKIKGTKYLFHINPIYKNVDQMY